MNRLILRARASLATQKEYYFHGAKLLIAVLILLAPFSQSFGAAVQWNTFLGGLQNNGASVRDVKVDASGFIYVVGDSPGVWGSPRRNFSGSRDAFVAKFNPAGGLEWNTFLGGSQGDSGNSLVLDSLGNIFVTGFTFGGGSSSTWGTPIRPLKASDTWVAKITNNGSLLWNTFVGSLFGNDEGLGITVDGSGNPIVVGRSDRAWGNTSVAGLPDINLLTPYHGAVDAFVLKLDTFGAIQWLTFVGGGTNQIPYGVALDSVDNIYVSGQSSGSWGAPIRAYTNSTDTFVARLSSAGTLQWNTFLGGTSFDVFGTIAIDNSDDLYVTGGTAGSWGTPLNEYSGFGDIMLVKLSDAGAILWNTFAGSDGNESGQAIDIDADGNVHIAGTSSSLFFGPVTTPPTTPKAGSFDAFAAKFDSNGAILAANFVGSSFPDDGRAIAIDNDGNIVTAGNARSWGEPITPILVTTDGFIAKICADCVTVSASSDAFGSVTKMLTAVTPGNTASIRVTPLFGYITDLSVGGTCAAGSWNGDVYTTGIVTVGCTVSFSHTNYNVTASVEDNGSVLPASVTTTSGNAVSFTVTPDPGYFASDTQVFGNCPSGSWAGNIYTTGVTTAPCSVFFEPQLIRFTASATVDDNGQFVEIDVIQTDGPIVGNGGPVDPQMASRSVLPGNSATFTIQANEGFETDQVAGGTCPTGSFDTGEDPSLTSYSTGPIFADCSVSFTHTALPNYTVTASVDPNGSISEPVDQVFEGSQAQFTILSNQGFRVDKDNVGGTCPIGSFDDQQTNKVLNGVVELAETRYTTGEISEDCTVIFVHLVIPSYTVMALVDEFGSLNVASVDVFEGDQASFDLTSNEGYFIDEKGGIAGDCPIGGFGRIIDIGTNGPPSGPEPRTYFTDEISADCTVIFTHSLNQYEVELVIDTDSVTVTPSDEFREVNHGQTLSYTVIAEEGFAPSISGSCGGILVGDTYTTLPVTDYCTVEIDAISAAYLISTQIDADEGMIFPEFFNIGAGETVGFEITPEEGYEVSEVSGCGGTWTGDNPYVIAPATEDCTVEPSFRIIGTEESDCSFFTIVTGQGLVAVCL